MNRPENPFASPALDAEPLTPESVEVERAEEIRRQHLSHEVSIRNVGLLFYLVAGVMSLGFCGGIMDLVGRWRGVSAERENLGMYVAILGGWAFAIALVVFLAHGMRTLSPGVRLPLIIYFSLTSLVALAGAAVLMAGGGMFWRSFIPLAISVYFLYLVTSSRGQTIFSAEYAEIRRQTPHIKYRISRVILVMLAILTGVLVLAGVAAALRLADHR